MKERFVTFPRLAFAGCLLCLGISFTAIADSHDQGDKNLHDEDSVIKAIHMERATISLTDAIRIAKSSHPGVVREAELDEHEAAFENGFSVYRIEMDTEKGRYEVLVDPVKGTIRKSSKANPFTALFRDQEPVHEKGKSVMGLSEAITLAERTTGGKAFDAELETEEDLLCYRVRVVNGNQTLTFLIDPVTRSQYQIRPDHHDDEE